MSYTFHSHADKVKHMRVFHNNTKTTMPRGKRTTMPRGTPQHIVEQTCPFPDCAFRAQRTADLQKHRLMAHPGQRAPYKNDIRKRKVPQEKARKEKQQLSLERAFLEQRLAQDDQAATTKRRRTNTPPPHTTQQH